MKLLRLKRKTAGGFHGWYETDLGFDVRKPLGQQTVFNDEGEYAPDEIKQPEQPRVEPIRIKRGIFDRIIQAIKNLIQQILKWKI